VNERIKQLWEEAAKTTQSDSWEEQTKFMERFAELIVQECMELFVDQKYMILNPHEPFANERVRALKEHDKDTVRKIKEHFGVEE
jgi:hypothetical protein